MKTKYIKGPLSFEAQANLLIQRGMSGDRELIINRLHEVNYYRLSAYWYPFREKESADNNLREGTQFDVVWDRYVFDRQLRLLVMDAIERVEISVRTRMTNLLTVGANDAFIHLRRNHFAESASVSEQGRLVNVLRSNASASKEEFVKQFKGKYGAGQIENDKLDLPLWMATEIMSFGNMLTLFKLMDMHTQREIAEGYGLQAKVLKSWLMTLNYVRNLYAHHARLWNREFAVRPAIPAEKSHPEWHEPEISSHRLFATLTILYYLLRRIAPQSGWAGRLDALLCKHPNIPLENMGFIDNWQNHPLWNHRQTGSE
jgi:abortive infection bacteriophage resistance protein